MLRQLWFKVAALGRPERMDAELREEIDAHLERETERHVAAGVEPGEARARARREFGNVTAIGESARESWRTERIDRTVRNARQGVRALRRRPAFSVAAILSLALGLGAATTVFSVVNALLLRPLPYRNADRLVAIWPAQIVANQEIERLRTASTSYANVASFSPGWLMGLTGVEAPRQVSAAKVSGNFFSMLGSATLRGRTFGIDAESPGSPSVAVLGEDLWESSFHRDSAIIGRSITLEGTQYTVLGIMPRSFRLLDPGADLWVPMTMDRTQQSWSGSTTLAIGELRPGVPLTRASAELRQLIPQMRTDFGHTADWGVNSSVVSLQSSITGTVTGTLTLVVLAVTFLLLIAVSNVTNLFVVRTAEREQELAVRTSLGASQRQLRGVLLAEAALIGAMGTAGGGTICVAAVAMLRHFLPPSTPRLAELSVDLRTFAAGIALVAIMVMLFTLVPARMTRHAGMAGTLRRGRGQTARTGRIRDALVALEFSLALFLTAGALLMGRTLMALDRVDRGLRSDHLLVMQVQPGANGDSAKRVFWSDVLRKVAAVPGVRGTATMLHLPMSGRSWHANILVDGRSVPPGTVPPRAAWQSVSQDYFTVAGVAVVAGRAFAASDDPQAPLAIAVNRAFARAIFPGENPIGRRIQAGFATAGQWATIVGVVADIPHDSLNAPATPEVYVTMNQRMVGASTLLVRTSVDPLETAASVRRAIATVDRDTPISGVRTMEDLYSASLQRPRLMLVLLALFAAAGILLSAIGIYGVVAYNVRQRTREIGIRAALGADARSLQWVFVRHGIAQSLVGLVVGIPIAMFAARLVRGLLFGVGPFDPVSFAVVAVVLIAVAVVASWIPARRAARVDPVTVLGGE